MFALPEINLKGKVSDEEWQLRVELAACYRLAHYYGWDDTIYTHISARLPGKVLIDINGVSDLETIFKRLSNCKM